jgi:hypothetical protein
LQLPLQQKYLEIRLVLKKPVCRITGLRVLVGVIKMYLMVFEKRDILRDLFGVRARIKDELSVFPFRKAKERLLRHGEKFLRNLVTIIIGYNTGVVYINGPVNGIPPTRSFFIIRPKDVSQHSHIFGRFLSLADSYVKSAFNTGLPLRLIHF